MMTVKASVGSQWRVGREEESVWKLQLLARVVKWLPGLLGELAVAAESFELVR